MRRLHQVLLGCVLGLLLVPIFPAFAADCGEIVERSSFGDYREPITDCTNPFQGNDDPQFENVEVRLDGSVLTEGDAITVDAFPVTLEPTVTYERIVPDSLTRPLGEVFENFVLYRHSGEDYITTFGSLEISEPGTYTLVVDINETPVAVSLLEAVRSWVIPTVYAQQFALSGERVAITFAVEVASEPTGASSVLFLPGIQASRLYTEGWFGAENRIWEPNRNNDVRLLEMDGEGRSVNDVYTRDVLDEIYGVSNIYRGFLDMLEEMQEDGEIVEYVPFAYDWRYDVFTIASADISDGAFGTKRLVEEVERLAAESHTGKVTIIGHSNGGLVGKALLYQYGDNRLSGLVDKLVLVGTPQLGTPKSIGSMLHGLDQQKAAGLIINDTTAREVIRNMPGAYTLLPSAGYFAASDEPVVSTDGSELAEAIAQYGDIDSAAELRDYVLDTEDALDDRPAINEPSTLNEQMLDEAQDFQSILDDYEVPEEVKVYEVVGTGLPTIVGFEYREFSCRETNRACVLRPTLKPFPLFTTNGDQTVVATSAGAYGGDKTTAHINLREDGEGVLSRDTEHADMTESPTVQDFLRSVIYYEYLAESLVIPPEFTDVSTRYTIVGTHSPVTLRAEDESGRVVGVVDGAIAEEVVGAEYFELAGSKYIVMPSDIDFSIEVAGQARGSYSITVDELGEDGTQETIEALVGLRTNPDMITRFMVEDGEPTPIKTDRNGDGRFERRYEWNGEWSPIRPTLTPGDRADKEKSWKNRGLRYCVHDRIDRGERFQVGAECVRERLEGRIQEIKSRLKKSLKNR